MLIPRYSIRWILGATTVAAVFGLFVRLALDGVQWAGAVALAIFSLVLCVVTYVAFFALVWVVSRVHDRRVERRSARGASTLPLVWIALAALAGSGLAGGPCSTPAVADGVLVTLPDPTNPKPFNTSPTGLSITYHTHWSAAPGYRPVQIKIARGTPAAADTTIAFDYKLTAPDGHLSLLCAQEVTLPAGAKQLELTLAVPYYSGRQAGDCDVYVDGVEAPELSLHGARYFGDEFSGITGLHVNSWHFFPNNGVFQQLGNRVNFIERQPAELPTRWIDYSSLDLVVLKLDEATKTAKEQPEAWQAITRWTRAGGNLWIVDPVVPSQSQARKDIPEGYRPLRIGGPVVPSKSQAAIDKLLGLPVRKAGADGLPSGWQSSRRAAGPANDDPKNAADIPPRRRVALTEDEIAEGIVDRDLLETDEVFIEESGIAPHEPLAAIPGDYSAIESFWRDYGLGRVRILPDFGTLDPAQMQAIAQATELDSSRHDWRTRHGVAFESENGHFWNFLIPGLGLPPVTAFRVLITLFVLAIGPLNYFLLRRWKRLHLLVVTVPLSAGLVTLLLFGYALLADGLGTHVRLRSVTVLDQPSGEAVCWSRQSYYAGIAPRDGLHFPNDVVVLPIEPAVRGTRYGINLDRRTRELFWEDDQHLASGWIESRTPTQFMTVRARRSERKLSIAPDELRITNALGSRIAVIALCDSRGKLHWAEDVAADGSAELVPFGPTHASRLRDLLVDQDLQVPVEMSGGIAAGPFQTRSTSNLRRFGPTSFSEASSQASRLEQTILSLRLIDASGPGPLPPRSYATIVDRSPEVPIGIAVAEEEASFHVILGNY